MNKYVEEIYEERGESVHHEEMATGSGIGKPIATKQKGQSSPQSYLVSELFVPIDQRKWTDIPAVDDVILSWRVSKIMTKMLRHHGLHQKDDGAIDWNSLLPMSCRVFENENARRWSTTEWLDLLHQGSDKKRFQYCLNSHGLIIYMRAIQGHSGGIKVDLALLDNVEILYGWSEYFHHVGCSPYAHSILQSGLIVAGKDAKRDDKQYYSPPWTP